MPFCVKLSIEAKHDIVKVYDYIKKELFAPASAEKFLRGIYGCISKLETLADVFAVSTYQDVLFYGKNARTVVYNGFTIIYTIHRRDVYIHRIIHGSLIRK